MTYVPQTVKDLYHLLENDFHPLDLAHKVQPLLRKLSELSDKLSSASPVPEVQLEQYIPGLERVTTLRVLQQVIVQFISTYFHVVVCCFVVVCVIICKCEDFYNFK